MEEMLKYYARIKRYQNLKTAVLSNLLRYFVELRRFQEARDSLKENEVNAIELMHPSEVLISLGRFRCGFIAVNECST